MSNIVPKPRGKLTPSLTGSYGYNTDSISDWLMMYCPNCNSDNVCLLHPDFNPEIEGRGRWFCISCYESWVYGVEDA